MSSRAWPRLAALFVAALFVTAPATTVLAAGGAPKILDTLPKLKPRKILAGRRPILVVVQSVKVTGALRGLIAADIQDARDRIERCADHVPSRRLVSGRVHVRMFVRGDGRVYARVLRSGLRLPKVRRCIAKTLAKVRLPVMYAVSRVVAL